ncbi:TPA: hypothetical protein OGU99_000357 [Escherichia coli]|nr:hypothetical protein [Escherichia coli]
MSISFNHPQNTVTSTAENGSLNLIVLGGTPTNPRPIRMNSSSVILPVQDLPVGEAGAIVFDKNTLTLKYHDGTNWIEMLSAADVVAPIEQQIQDINSILGTKVDRVTYSMSSIPTASISGTTLNIIFPTPSSIQGANGLYTSAKPGCIMHYSLTSGQTVDSIREQMSGSTGGQNGREGTQAKPWKTSDGWCFADGMWWEWVGTNGPIKKQVPNLNRDGYLRSITTSGITKTDAMIAGGGSLTPSTFTIPDHIHGTGKMLGTNGSDADDAVFISGRAWNDGRGYRGPAIFGDKNARMEFSVDGNNAATALSTSQPIYDDANARTITHNHTVTGIDVPHFNTAILYNISEPSVAMSENTANDRFVRKTGDTMSGELYIANRAGIRGGGDLYLFFQNASGGERAAVYFQGNELRLRAGGGAVTVNSGGSLYIPGSLTVNAASATVGTKHIVRSVNGSTAGSDGNVNISVGSVQDVRFFNQDYYWPGGNELSWHFVCPSGAVLSGINVQDVGKNSADNIGGVNYKFIQILVDGSWRNING